MLGKVQIESFVQCDLDLSNLRQKAMLGRGKVIECLAVGWMRRSQVWCLLPYGDAQKFTSKDSFEPCCCACGTGYVRKPAGGPPEGEEMER